MNFAPLIQCPAMVGVGRQDTVVPAETVYAFINHLSCKKEVRDFPVSHSSSPEEKLWDNFEKEWLHHVLQETF
jgi:cephalosporin-C deacetylase-like acetyl esterase